MFYKSHRDWKFTEMQFKLKYKKTIIDMLVTILLTLCIFAPEIRFLPYYTWILSLIGCCICLKRQFRSYIGFLNKSNIYFWLHILLAMIIVLIPPLVHQTNDYSYLIIIFGIVTTSFRSILLIYILYRIDRKKIFENYCFFFIKGCCVYVLFTLIFICFPKFKDFWCTDVLTSVYETDYYYYIFRYSLNGFAGFSAASIMSFGCIISGYIIANEKKLNIYHIVQFILIITGCFFYGRITIFGIILGMLLVFSQKSNAYKNFKLILIIMTIFMMLILLLNYLASISDEFFYWRKWAFAILDQVFVKHNVTDYSVVHMFEDMYFLPDVKTLILGDGYYTDPFTGKYYMSTDVGFMRVILYGGGGCICILFGMLIFLIYKTYVRTESKLRKRLFIFTAVLWMILEMKGESYQRIIMLVYPLFLVTLSEVKNYCINFKQGE